MWSEWEVKKLQRQQMPRMWRDKVRKTGTVMGGLDEDTWKQWSLKGINCAHWYNAWGETVPLFNGSGEELLLEGACCPVV